MITGHVMANGCAIAAGGALGALGRWGMANLVVILTGRAFPWATLAVNVLGSLLMGAMFIAIVQNEAVRREWESVLTVGFLGAFTTFSTFALETAVLLEAGRNVAAMAYVAASVMLCTLGVAVGWWLARQLL